MNKEFEAFKQTLSADSLKDIYDETRVEVAENHVEGTEAFTFEMATQMAVNLLEAYQRWLADKKLED